MLAALRLNLLLLCGLATPISLAAQQAAASVTQEAQGELAAFQGKSAHEILQQHFHGPPFPLFVIRRFIELGDPLVISALEGAFAQETSEITRQFLAAALVSLGDPDPQYYNYVASAAAAAVASDLPLPVRLGGPKAADSALPSFTAAFASWVERHGGETATAMRRATFDLPAAVEALGESGDPRSFSILIRGLNSPNILVVMAAALGLARLHDDRAVPAIIAACERLPAEEGKLVAKALLYFATPAAQRAAERLVADPARIKRWRADVDRLGWKGAMRDRGY
jgi:HEAT repeat protein